MRKEYKYARINYDFDDKKEHPVFIEKYLGKESLLNLSKVERLLNKYAEESEELKNQIKRNDSLTTRISQLRNDLEVSKSRETDDKAIRQVCQIIQDRIDFVSGERVTYEVSEHLKRVKENLEKEGLWRI